MPELDKVWREPTAEKKIIVLIPAGRKHGTIGMTFVNVFGEKIVILRFVLRTQYYIEIPVFLINPFLASAGFKIGDWQSKRAT